MTRIGRYWLFFVIVAVGLALSWGQVGRQTQRVLEAGPVTFLTVERACRPRISPCAAFTSDRALVLGPDRAHGLKLRQTGFDPASLAGVEAMLIDGERRVAVTVRERPDGWTLALTEDASAVLRVQVSAAGELSVAEFPLD